MWHKLSADNMDPDFVERRRVGLENFLLRVASHPVMSSDGIFYHFLTQVCICVCEYSKVFIIYSVSVLWLILILLDSFHIVFYGSDDVGSPWLS